MRAAVLLTAAATSAIGLLTRLVIATESSTTGRDTSQTTGASEEHLQRRAWPFNSRARPTVVPLTDGPNGEVVAAREEAVVAVAPAGAEVEPAAAATHVPATPTLAPANTCIFMPDPVSFPDVRPSDLQNHLERLCMTTWFGLRLDGAYCAQRNGRDYYVRCHNYAYGTNLPVGRTPYQLRLQEWREGLGAPELVFRVQCPVDHVCRHYGGAQDDQHIEREGQGLPERLGTGWNDRVVCHHRDYPWMRRPSTRAGSFAGEASAARRDAELDDTEDVDHGPFWRRPQIDPAVVSWHYPAPLQRDRATPPSTAQQGQEPGSGSRECDASTSHASTFSRTP